MLRAGGIGRYIRETTGPWLAEKRVEEIRFLGRPEELEPWLEELESVALPSIGVWRDRPYRLSAQLRWPWFRKRLGWEPDVTFFPHYDVPLISHPNPSVVTVHDLTQFKLPWAFPWWKRRVGAGLLHGALTRASRILTVSEHSRGDILEMRPDVSEKIEVVPNGVSAVFGPLSEAEKEATEARFGELMPFVLALGDSRPHKNLRWVLKVVEHARAKWPELNLVLVTATDGRPRELLSSVGKREWEEWIHTITASADGQLRELFALCEAFLFPSLYEGFGLPPLEAAACGTRVLVSDRAALPEVIGEQGLLLDPEDLSGWVEAILQSSEGRGAAPGLLYRAGEGGLGFPRWVESSRRTLDALFSAASSAGQSRQ